MRTRRYLIGAGAQRLSRETLRVVSRHTLDFDFKACVFRILSHLLPRIKVSLDHPQIKLVHRIAKDSADVIRELGLEPSEGKQVLLRSLNCEGSQPGDAVQLRD